MSEKIKAIVIKSNDRKEKDKDILLFSLEKGKFWASLKGIKNPNAKLKTAKNQFSFGEFLIEEGKGGYVISGFESIENFHELAEDIDKYFEASAILEAVDKLDFSSQSERTAVFLLTLKALKNVCFLNIKQYLCLIKFFIEIFKISGNSLYTDKCSSCGNKAFDKIFIDYSIGELVCVSCRGPFVEEVPKNAYLALKILTNSDFDKLSSIKLASGSELILLKILVKNFESLFATKLKLIGILS